MSDALAVIVEVVSDALAVIVVEWSEALAVIVEVMSDALAVIVVEWSEALHLSSIFSGDIVESPASVVHCQPLRPKSEPSATNNRLYRQS